MNYLILGASGFIGQHLTRTLLAEGHLVRGFDRYCHNELSDARLTFVEGIFSPNYDFESLVDGQDIVFHLISTTLPSMQVPFAQEIEENLFSTLALLDACVKKQVKRVIFISSGGTVYGQSAHQPFKESSETNPIASYGIQKLMIEKYLHLYYHKYGLDYRIVRLSNPYGPGQNPKGAVGAITVFLDRALANEEITIFGDGTSVRDYIYIDDTIRGLINIATSESQEKVYNLGSGQGTSLLTILSEIETLLGRPVKTHFLPKRDSDVTYSVLETMRYQKAFPQHTMLPLREGIRRYYQTLLHQGKD